MAEDDFAAVAARMLAKATREAAVADQQWLRELEDCDPFDAARLVEMAETAPTRWMAGWCLAKAAHAAALAGCT